jgi:hypothetical protein
MAGHRSNMQNADLFTCTCLALALNRRDAGILETLFAEDAVFRHQEEKHQIDGKEAILVFFRIWFHNLNLSLEAGISSLNAELAKIRVSNESHLCLLIRQNVRGGSRRFLSLFLSQNGLISSLEFRSAVSEELEELHIFPC